MHSTTSDNPPDVVEDDARLFWDKAINDLTAMKDLRGGIVAINENQKSLKEILRLGSTSNRALINIGSHFDQIKAAIDGIGFIVDAISTVVPMVAPLKLITSSLAWVAKSASKVTAAFKKLENFFSQMASHFQDLLVLNDALKTKGFIETQVRIRILKLFGCSANICTIAIQYAKNGFSAWIDINIKGDRLSDAFSEFKTASEMLQKVVSTSTLAVVDRLDKKLDEHREQQASYFNRDMILNCLSMTDARKTYNSLGERVEFQPNAGDWLLKSKKFIDWRDGDVNKIWYLGKRENSQISQNLELELTLYAFQAGAGKSVLATIVIRHLESLRRKGNSPPADPVLAFLYLSYKNKVGVDELLGSIARQLISQYRSLELLPQSVRDILQGYLDLGTYKDPGISSRPSTDDLRKIISAFANQRKVYIVVDAMDECPIDIRRGLMKHLIGVEHGVKLLVTSRLLENQNTLCAGFQQNEVEAHQEDIEGFIDTVLDGNAMLMRHRGDIQDTVKRKSGGIFLLARLHMDALKDVVIERKIQHELASLPSTVDESYKKAMDRINDQTGDRGKFAYDIMAWTSYALRPLSLEELQFAIAVKGLGKESRVTGDMLFKDTDLSPFCCGLIVKDETDTVRFVHYSARDYFVNNKEDLFPDYHLVASFSCAKYLSSISVGKILALDANNNEGDLISVDTDDLEGEEQLEPFASYAASFLHEHYRHIRNLPGQYSARGGKEEQSRDGDSALAQFRITNSQLMASICTLLEGRYSRLLYFQLLMQNDAYFSPSKYLDSKFVGSWYWKPSKYFTTPLHLAVFLGCPSLVELLISDGSNINGLDSFEQPPLIITLKKSFDDIASILLDHGAVADLATKHGHLLLLYAAQRDYEQSVKRILNADNQLTLWTLGDGGIILLSPVLLLLYVVGSLLAFSSLVEFGRTCAEYVQGRRKQDQKPYLNPYGELLFYAYSGDEQSLRHSLRTLEEADPDTGKGNVGAVLIDNTDGNDDDNNDESDEGDESDDDNDSPSFIGANQKIYLQEVLVTACFLSLEYLNIPIVEMLLDAGVDIDSQDYEGQTLLHRATFRNNIKFVNLLLRKGAEVDKQDHRGKTALMANADMEHEEVLKILLNHGADIHLVYENHREIHEIYKAAAHGRTSVVRFFLTYGVPPSIYGENGWTPLHAAAANGHLDCVKLLIEKGANPSSISDTGKTPLDFVRNQERLYDLPLLGETKVECEAYRKEHENYQDMDIRMVEIEAILVGAGAETSDQLYARIGRDEFNYGEGGKYTHKYYGDSYKDEIDAFADSKKHRG